MSASDVEPIKRLQVKLSKLLSEDNVAELQVLYDIPEKRHGKPLTALSALTYLQECGRFSVWQPKGLIDIMKNIDRFDLVETVKLWINVWSPPSSHAAGESKQRTEEYLGLVHFALQNLSELKVLPAISCLAKLREMLMEDTMQATGTAESDDSDSSSTSNSRESCFFPPLPGDVSSEPFYSNIQEAAGRLQPSEEPQYANICPKTSPPKVAPKPRRVQAGTTAHAKQPSAPSAGTEDYIYTQTSSKSGDSGFCEPKEWVGESAPPPPPAPSPGAPAASRDKQHRYTKVTRDTLDDESLYQSITK